MAPYIGFDPWCAGAVSHAAMADRLVPMAWATKYATAGQIAADLLAITTGHFEAVRHLDEEELLLAM